MPQKWKPTNHPLQVKYFGLLQNMAIEGMLKQLKDVKLTADNIFMKAAGDIAEIKKAKGLYLETYGAIKAMNLPAGKASGIPSDDEMVNLQRSCLLNGILMMIKLNEYGEAIAKSVEFDAIGFKDE